MLDLPQAAVFSTTYAPYNFLFVYKDIFHKLLTVLVVYLLVGLYTRELIFRRKNTSICNLLNLLLFFSFNNFLLKIMLI